MWVGVVDKLLGNRVLTVEEGTYNYGMWVGKKKSYGDMLQLDEEMATNSSILAWEIPWSEEPGRLQSLGRTESDTTE